MGCLKKLGCLVVLVLLAIVAWLTRDTWLSALRREPSAAGRELGSTWQPLTPDGARRAQAALQRLSSSGGAEYVTVAPGDLAAYIFQELSHSLPSSADSIEAAAIGDRLYVRAVLPTKDLGGTGGLGPLSALLGDRERVQMGGMIRIIEPGLGELQVKEFKIRELTLPRALIPRLIREMARGERPPELSPDGLPLKTPEYIGDVRVANGQVTLYKTALSR